MSEQKSCKKTSIAGQALIEGILMRGPKKTAIVCRKPGEEMVVKEEPTGTMSHGAWARLPIIRGVVSFWDSMKFGMSAAMAWMYFAVIALFLAAAWLLLGRKANKIEN